MAVESKFFLTGYNDFRTGLRQDPKLAHDEKMDGAGAAITLGVGFEFVAQGALSYPASADLKTRGVVGGIVFLLGVAAAVSMTVDGIRARGEEIRQRTA